jgi:uracil-DNA glycosylase family 4
MESLQSEIVRCNRCTRLRDHCRRIAEVKRKSYQDSRYWGKPVPSFGSVDCSVLIVGLAPGAHGANRTGRMFTGDRSGDFLYRALYDAGFATQPTSVSADDGLGLIDCLITAPVHCAPPDNKPDVAEFAACRPFLERELVLLSRLQVVVVLGGLAHKAYLSILKDAGNVKSFTQYPFSHGAVHRPAPDLPTLLCCYHPSQQNTQTGRLTAEMMLDVFQTARKLVDPNSPK